MEPRPVDRRRARGPEAVMRVRRQVHPGRRRVRVYFRGRAGRTGSGRAAIKLRESGEEEAVELRCARYYRSRCRRSALAGDRLLEWLEWADLEIDNIRAVLQRCLVRADAEVGID